MVDSVQVDHVGDFVVLSGPEGKLARIEAESAVRLGLEIMDAASKALENNDKSMEE